MSQEKHKLTHEYGDTPIEPSEEGERPRQSRCNLIIFMSIMCAGAMGNGFAIPSANQLSSEFNVKYGWTDKSEQDIHQSLIGSSVVIGCAIGAFSGGKMIPYGRRLSMILTSVCGLIGISLCLIENFYLLLIGRVIYGFASGAQGTIVIRMIKEYVPTSKTSKYVAIYAVSQNFASLIALCSALMLPQDTDIPGLEADGLWRLILGFPLILFAWIIIGFLLFQPYDSPKFYAAKGMKQQAINSIHQVFKTKGSQYMAEQILGDIQAEMAGGASGGHAQTATMREAFVSDERYVRASWVNVGAMIFHELTAINIILSYSNVILENILGEDSKSGFSARQGTYVVGAANFLASCMSIGSMQLFGRRQLLLFGQSGIFIVYLLMGIFTITDIDAGVLAMLAAFLFVYQNTSGPVAWCYVSETCCDVALGANLFVLYSVVLVLSLTTQPLMDSILQPQGVFFLFSGFSLVAIPYMYFYVPETKGLSDSQKKELFHPGSKWGRPLKEGEPQFSEQLLGKESFMGPKQADIGNTFITSTSSLITPSTDQAYGY